MNELKATTVYDAYWKANSVGEGTGIQIYLKSEVDRYISELIADQQLELDEWYCRVEHQKYKRCLAMAMMLEHICPITIRKAKWKGKWHLRWLELAEKFKEAK